MELIMMMSDILGACGMMFFFVAEVLQLRKIMRKKTVRSLSYHTYKTKLAAIILTIGCFSLAELWLSCAVLISELIIVLYILKLMRQHRGY